MSYIRLIKQQRFRIWILILKVLEKAVRKTIRILNLYWIIIVLIQIQSIVYKIQDQLLIKALKVILGL